MSTENEQNRYNKIGILLFFEMTHVTEKNLIKNIQKYNYFIIYFLLI